MEDILTVDQFAEKIKSKYPEYKDIDNYDLTEKIIAKYPVYKDMVDFQKKNQIESTGLSGEDISTDTQVVGVGEPETNEAPVIETPSETQGWLATFEESAQRRSKDGDLTYKTMNAANLGSGLGAAFLDQAYNAIVNTLPASFETTFQQSPRSKQLRELEKNIEKAQQAESDFVYDKYSERDGAYRKISIPEAQSKLSELKKLINEDVVSITEKREESSKYQDPDASISKMFTPLGFTKLLGAQLPNLGVSVVLPVVGSYAQIYGDTYMTTLEQLAAKKFKVEAAEVTPDMMIDLIERGEDGMANSELSSAAGASLDVIGLGKIAGIVKGPLSGLIRNSVKKGLQNGGRAGVVKALNVTGQILSGAAFEGATEGGQSFIQQMGTGLALDKTWANSFNSVDWNQILMEGTAGALIGGPISGITASGIKFNSNDVDAMIAENDLGGIRQFSDQGMIDWRTIPNKTLSRIEFTEQKVGDKKYIYPTSILKENLDEQTTDPTGVPQMDATAESIPNQVDGEAGSTTTEGQNQTEGAKDANEITQEDIDYATSQIDLGVLNWDHNPMTMRVDLGIERADVSKGEADIKRGKPNSAPAKRLIIALRDAKKKGIYSYFSGSGSNISRQNVPITEQFLGEVALTLEEIEDINKKENQLSLEYDEWFNALDEGSQNEIRDDYEKDNTGMVGSDAQGRESKENVSNQEESIGDEKPRGESEQTVQELVAALTLNPEEVTPKKDVVDVVNNVGATIIDETTPGIGILSTAIKSTQKVKSKDGSDLVYVLAENDEQFGSIIDELIADKEKAKEAKESNAYYDPTTHSVIYNKAKLNETTIVHEVVHPVLEAYMVENTELVNQLAADAMKSDPTLADFVSPYEQEDKALEAVVEGLARAAQSDFEKTGSVRIKIKDFFDNLLAKVGFNRDVVIKGDESYVQLSRKLSDAFRRGRAIVISDKAGKSGEGKIREQKSSNKKSSKEYTEAELSEIETIQENSATTQRANTVTSYEKAAKNLYENKQPESVLDYGAGLGLGTDAMSEILGVEVDSLEPNTENWKGSNPVSYTEAKDINKKYDAVVSLNVVNVVPKGMRDFIIKDIFEKLNEGGVALISSRPWSGDIATTKYFKEGPEEKSILVKGVKDGEVIDVYQKGFDKNELVDYAQELLGPNAEVTKDTSFGKMAIQITKVAEVKGEGNTREQKSSNPIVERIRRQVRPGKKISKGLRVFTFNKQKVKEESPDLSLQYVREKAPDLFIANAIAIAQYDIIKKSVDFNIETLEDAQKVYDLFARKIADNLTFLIDNFDPKNRDFATLWYDGANKIAHELAKKYNTTAEQVAGIIASLSPQMDWYQNVRLAELVLIAFESNPILGKAEIDYQIKINKIGENEAFKKITKAKEALKKSRTKANKAKVIELEGKYNEKVEANTILVDRLSSLIGSKLSEVPNEYKKYFIRTFNEVNTTKDYNVLNPDGTVMGVAKNTNGKNSPVAWGSYTEIGKAVSVYLDGSARNITESLGEMHKIRNFYNNIIDPMSEDGDVTMDTHAVAAALLKAVSGNSEEVSHNFGTNKTGSSIRIKSSAPNGIQGIYYAFQEGYKLAGKENNLLPRQVQSITWENIRSIFTKTFKNKAKNVNEINKIWLDYTANKIDIDEARKRIVKYSGGFKPPTWARSGAIQERPGKDNRKETDRGGSLRDGQSTVGTTTRRDGGGERSRLRFQKQASTTNIDDAVSLRNLLVDNQGLLMTELVYKKLLDNGVAYDVVKTFRSLAMKLIKTTLDLQEAFKEENKFTAEQQQEAILKDIESYRTQTASLRAFVLTIIKDDQLRRVFQGQDTIKKLYKNGKLGEKWTSALQIIDPRKVDPAKFSKKLFAQYANVIDVISRKLKRGILFGADVQLIYEFQEALFKANENNEIDFIANEISPYVAIYFDNEAQYKGEPFPIAEGIELQGDDAFLAYLAKELEANDKDPLTEHQKNYFKKNKAKILAEAKQLTLDEGVTDLVVSIPAKARPPLWNIFAKAIEEYNDIKYDEDKIPQTLDEFLDVYIEDNFSEDTKALLKEDDNRIYIIKQGKKFAKRNGKIANLLSTLIYLKSAGDITQKIFSDKEKGYIRTLLSLLKKDNTLDENDLLNFENHEIDHITKTLQGVEASGWVPPIALRLHTKINNIRLSVELGSLFMGDGVFVLMDNLGKYIPTFERELLALIKGKKNTTLQSKIQKLLAGSFGVAQLGQMSGKGFEVFMNNVYASWSDVEFKLKKANNTRTRLFLAIGGKTEGLSREDINILVYMKQLEMQFLSNPNSEKVPKLSALVGELEVIDNIKEKPGDIAYEQSTAAKLWKIFGKSDNTLDLEAVDKILVKAKAKEYYDFISKESQDSQHIVAHNIKYSQGKPAELLNNHVTVRVVSDTDKALDIEPELFPNMNPVGKSKTSISRQNWKNKDGSYKSGPISFDSFGISSFSKKDQFLDYYFRENYTANYAALTTLSKTLNENGRAVVKALQLDMAAKTTAVAARVRTMDTYATSAIRGIKKSQLSGLVRIPKEYTANLMMALTNSRVFKAAFITGELVSKEGAQLLTSYFKTSQKERIDDPKFYTVANEDPRESLIARPANWWQTVSNKIKPLTDVSNSVIGFSDKKIAIPMWRASFYLNFEELTGISWDDSFVKNETLREQFKEEIIRSMALADILVVKRWQGNSLYSTKVSFDETTSRYEDAPTGAMASILNWYGTFRTGHSTLINESWSVINPSKRSQGSMNKKEAYETLVGAYGSILVYSVASKLAVDAIWNLALNALTDDEDDGDESKISDSLSNAFIEIALLSSRLGRSNSVIFAAAMMLLNVGKKTIENTEESSVEAVAKSGLKELKKTYYSPYTYNRVLGGYGALAQTLADPLFDDKRGSVNHLVNTALVAGKFAGVPFLNEVRKVADKILPKKEESKRKVKYMIY